MPVLCDFVQIVGDAPVNIGDSLPVWEVKFNTGGRDSSGTAFLIFNVRALTHTNVNVNVKINNKTIGQIARYGGLSEAERADTAHYWYTQMIAMNGSNLNNGDNEIQIEAVGFPGATNTNKFDDFQLKNVICFFHQSA
jgi:hypothetical protein